VTDLVLRADGLLSKWGFNDGDEPDWLLDALDERGLTYPADWHEVLWRLVNEHLLPALDQRVELVRIQTNHNPARASTVKGEDVSGLWTSDAATCLTPKSVTVPLEAVLDAIRTAGKTCNHEWMAPAAL
jgi:hypothetical protein